MSTNAIYIPSKGRPDCATAQYLTNIGYPADWTILLGDDDDTIDEYLARWGSERISIFDKKEAMANTDLMDAYGDTKASGVAPARNEVAKLARDNGLVRCWMFDDDYDAVIRTNVDGSRKVYDDGAELFHALDEIEQFGLDTGIPVIGFDTTPWGRGEKDAYRSHVYNGFNIDVREGSFIPFKGRLYEDGVHTMTMARLGKTDFGFRHLMVRPLTPGWAWNDDKNEETAGGLSDLYRSYIDEDEKRSAAKVANCQYVLMVAPTQIYLYRNKSGYHAYYDNKNEVKIISEQYARSL